MNARESANPAQEQNPPVMPEAVGAALARLRLRLAILAIARCIGGISLILSLILILEMTFDLIKPLHQWIRATIWLVSLGLAVRMVVRLIAGPLGHRPKAWELAALLESRMPELKDAVSGPVSLAEGRMHGSPALAGALAQAAGERLAEPIDLEAIAPAASARNRLGTGLCAALAIAFAVLLAPDPCRVLLARSINPWGDLPPVSKLKIIVAPGDGYAPLGGVVRVLARIEPRFGAKHPESAVIEWIDARGRRGQAKMTTDSRASMPPERGFAAALPRIEGNVSYRVTAGTSHSKRHTLIAVEPPVIQSLEVAVEPPAYAKLPVQNLKDPRKITALKGSRAAFELVAKAPVAAAGVSWPMIRVEPVPKRSPVPRAPISDPPSPLPLERRDQEGRRWGHEFFATASGPFAVRLWDEHGFINNDEPERLLVVVADKPPEISFLDQEPAADLRPDDPLDPRIQAGDDLGISGVELEIAIERQGSSAKPTETRRERLALAGLFTQRAGGAAPIDLKPYALKPGDRVRYRAWAYDTLPSPEGPQTAATEERVLSITDAAEPLFARRSAAARKEVSDAINTVKKEAEANRRETERLRYAADAARRDPSAWSDDRDRELAEREAKARHIVELFETIARRAETAPALAPLAELARDAAHVEAEATREILHEAAAAADPRERLDALRLADARQAATAQRADQLQAQLEKLAGSDVARGKLESLARRERDLAEEVEALERSAQAKTPLDRARLDRVQAEQENVRRELDQTLADRPELRAGMTQELNQRANDLAGQARKLAEDQRGLARETAAAARDSRALAALAEEQRAIAAEVRRLGLELDPTMHEHGRGGANAAAASAPIESLAGADAEGARSRMESSLAELKRLASDARDIRTDPKLALKRLARREERLANELNDALSGIDREPKSDRAKAELARRMVPLAQTQEAIARVAGEIKAPQAPAPPRAAEAIGKAAESATKARETLRNADARDAGGRINDARDALNRAGDDLPDPRQIREHEAQAMGEFARTVQDAIRDSGNLIRERDERLAREPGLNRSQLDAEFANRLRPIASRLNEASERLAKAPTAAHGHARESALSSARAFAQALERRDTKELDEKGRVAVAGAERLARRAQGGVADDEHAAHLAEDQATLAKRLANGESSVKLLAGQARIAAALAALDLPDARDTQRKAVAAARSAERALAQGRDATKAIAEAVETTRALAGRPAAEDDMREPAGLADAPIKPEDLGQIRELSRRQERLLEQLAALGAKEVEPQRELERKTAELARAARRLSESTQPFQPQAEHAARESADLLERQAEPAMREADGRLLQGRLAQARHDQNRASDAVEAAARRLEDLAGALASDRSAHAGSAAPQTEQDPLGRARESLAEASSRLARDREPGRQSPGAEARTSQAMRSAAESLHHAVERGAEVGASPPVPSGSPADQAANHPASGEPRAQQAGVADPDLAELKDLVQSKTGRKWGELPENLREEILRMSRKPAYRDDYRSLIRLYFREIASGERKKE